MIYSDSYPATTPASRIQFFPYISYVIDLRARFEKLNYESQIILLICILGSLRTAVALIMDLTGEIRLPEISVDFTIFCVFAFLAFFVSGRPSIQSVHPAFGVLLTLLLALNFLQFGGVEGSTKYNYYSGLYAIIMLYSAKRLLLLVSFHLLVAAALVGISLFNQDIFMPLFLGEITTPVEFWFTLLVISLFTFYLKHITDITNEKMEALGHDLNGKVQEAKLQNHKLVQQASVLKDAQQRLEIDVAHRTRVLQKKYNSVEEYIHLNAVKLDKPLTLLIKSVEEVKGNSHLLALLKSSAVELQLVTKKIQSALQAEKQLNRNHIKPHE